MMQSSLLSPWDRQQYGERVFTWLDDALRYFSDENWQRPTSSTSARYVQHSTTWRCLNKFSPPEPIDYTCGGVRLFFDFRALAENLPWRKATDPLAAVRKQLFDLARKMLAEGTPIQRRRLASLKREHSKKVTA